MGKIIKENRTYRQPAPARPLNRNAAIRKHLHRQILEEYTTFLDEVDDPVAAAILTTKMPLDADCALAEAIRDHAA